MLFCFVDALLPQRQVWVKTLEEVIANQLATPDTVNTNANANANVNAQSGLEADNSTTSPDKALSIDEIAERNPETAVLVRNVVERRPACKVYLNLQWIGIGIGIGIGIDIDIGIGIGI